ncbi:MAG: fibrobacter succinogenes major paralogous domain-containing protein [Bacteroidia bacterium]|nr:fibrobacter succinogenes major paralogous domain-containing protein [Bacteroidia bacterium]
MESKSLLITIAIIIIAMSSVAQKTRSFVDSRNGKTYKTIKIGKQTWMAENLAYKAKSGCWVYYDDTTNLAKYGYLYDWKTAKDVCPAGWHLPGDAEWSTLTDYLGGRDVAGSKLKSTTGWDSPNIGATNETGFTALPGGYRFITGSFNRIDSYGYWWSFTEWSTFKARYWYIGHNTSSLYRDFEGFDKSNGLSVRCVKNN